MVYKLISSKTIIGKVISDLNLTDNDLRISDMQQWIGEAVEKIGAINIVNKKVSGEHGEDYIKLKDYQAALPCDLHSLHSVAYSHDCSSNSWMAMRMTTNSFGQWSHKDSEACTGGDCGRFYNEGEVARVYADMQKDYISNREALDELNINPNAKQVITSLIEKGEHNHHHYHAHEDLQYTLKPGYINCNVRDGWLKLAYSAIPRDEHGYVMVPDLTSVTEAIYWYVTMKLSYPEYYKGKMRQDIYFGAQNSWNFYRKQAYAEIMMPNQDMMESVRNVWHKIYPEQDDHASFYSHTGDRQLIYNANRRGYSYNSSYHEVL